MRSALRKCEGRQIPQTHTRASVRIQIRMSNLCTKQLPNVTFGNGVQLFLCGILESVLLQPGTQIRQTSLHILNHTI
jgi:hypothetical protein